MASPGLQSMCCLFVNKSQNKNDTNFINWNTVVYTYNVLCVISSTLSICGAIYQLLPRQPKTTPRTKKEMDSFMRQNMIICWLAVADLLASTGILVRSAVWLAGFIPWMPSAGKAEVDPEHIFCAVSSAWIQYFYLCTYIWTFLYAVDIFLLVHDKPCQVKLYHLLSWLVPAVLTLAGLLPFYLPSLTSCSTSVSHWIGHYLFTYIPILVVMVCNPILYWFAHVRVKNTIRGRGLYTDHERKTISNIRTKFFSVTLVFYLCWSANILNGFLLLFGEKISSNVVLGVWHFMAVMNPLQAFLNSIVYRGMGGCNFRWHQEAPRSPLVTRTTALGGTRERADIQHLSTSHTDMDDSVSETSPLLSFRT